MCKQLPPNVKRASGESANSFATQHLGNKRVCEPTGGRRRSLKANKGSAAQARIVKDHESKDKERLLLVNRKDVPAHTTETVRLLTRRDTTVVTLPTASLTDARRVSQQQTRGQKQTSPCEQTGTAACLSEVAEGGSGGLHRPESLSQSCW